MSREFLQQFPAIRFGIPLWKVTAIGTGKNGGQLLQSK
jgi:hypothetical protein